MNISRQSANPETSLLARITAFLLLLFVSIINLTTNFAVVKTLISERLSYQFDSWNFLYQLILLPIDAVLYFLAILLIAVALKLSGDRKHILLLPVYIIFLKVLLLMYFRPGPISSREFDLAFLRDYAIDCLMFLFAAIGLLIHIIKRDEFSTAPAGMNRKAALP
jgi:hypothetical protein